MSRSLQWFVVNHDEKDVQLVTFTAGLKLIGVQRGSGEFSIGSLTGTRKPYRRDDRGRGGGTGWGKVEIHG